MKRSPGILSACRVLIALSVSASGWAQTTVDGVRSTYVVDGTNASIQETHAPVAPLPPAPVLVNVGDGALWSESDGGQGWIGRTVALGDHGTQVFTEFDTAADRAQLLSSFDSAPVTPLFENPQVEGSQDAKVDAANDAGVYVSCRQVPIALPNGLRNTYVSLYTATGGLQWTYQFPATTYGPARAMISRDGTRIVAGMLDTGSNLQLRVFGLGSNVPVWSGSYLNGPVLRSLLMTADGNLVYWAAANTINIWDVNTHQVVSTIGTFGALDCHAISADGRVFAYGGFNNVDVFERQAGGNWIRTYQWNVPGVAVCGKLDVSADGSTIVAGFNLWDFNVGVQILALDVPTKTVTMTDTAIGAGTLQNIVSDIAVSANGDRFVVGLWGDEAHLVDQLRFYRRNQNAPVATYPYPGSVYDLDLSADGHRVAVATKAVHANLYTGGGSIDLYSFEDEDLMMHGIPRIGSVVQFEMHNVPNSPARLLVSPSAALHPLDMGLTGMLGISRIGMTSVSMGTTGVHGIATRDYNMPTIAATIGTKRCFQGLATSPRRLTESWIELTILP
jgi:hypothetical protein